MKKNRTLLGILCVILAVAVTFGITPLVNQITSGKVEIVRIKSNIPQGRTINKEDIETVSVGGYNLPKEVLKKPEEVIGKYAACDLMANDYLLPSKISDTADRAEDVFKTLDGSKQAISISIPSFAGGLSGKLQNGDIVSVIVQQDKQSVIPAELKYLRVITTTSSDGVDKDQVENNEDGTAAQPSTITLLVNTAQAKLLAQYNINSQIHLTLVYRGDETTANKFLQAQEKVFAEVQP